MFTYAKYYEIVSCLRNQRTEISEDKYFVLFSIDNVLEKIEKKGLLLITLK